MKKNKKSLKKYLTAGIVLIAAIVLVFLWTRDSGPQLIEGADFELSSGSASGRYAEYIAKYEGKGFSGESIVIDATSYKEASETEVQTVEGIKALCTGEESNVTWEFDVAKAGLYVIKLDYCPMPGYGSAIERNILIDGEMPFDEAGGIQFTRVYVDEELNPSGKKIRPNQMEIFRWNEEYITDSLGYCGSAAYFYFDEGKHTITFESVKEPMAMSKITLVSEDISPMSYADYIAKHDAMGAKKVEGSIAEGVELYQAENATEKGDPTLYAQADTSSSITQPYSYSARLMNSIGGTAWKYTNQWISWTINVPEDGYYNLGARVKQNFVRDIKCNRTLYIDDAIPFEEAEYLEFEHQDDWRCNYFSDSEGNPYLFYLTAGEHTLKLKVTLGNLKDILTEAEFVITNLNMINLDLLAMLTTSPDVDRDYQLDKYMPDTIVEIEENCHRLEAIYNEMILATSANDALTSQVEQLIQLLKAMYTDPDDIPGLYKRYRSLVGGLGDWMNTMREHSLLIDYIFVSEPSAKVNMKEENFFQALKASVMGFISSFTTDYTVLSEEAAAHKDEAITVWIGSGLTGGRDQAMALNQMVEDTFTAQTGIRVNLQLVNENTVLTATLAGRGPDIALQVSTSDPVDYALRNTVYDLTQFDDYEEVAKRFFAGATEPFEYDGGVYALPETLSFPMLFYRTDIMDELGIDVSKLKTWEGIIEILPVLQTKNMQFALPYDNGTFSMFLFQRDGEYYMDDDKQSALGEKVALDAFEYWTDFYSVYSLPVDFSFENRFRTGEMPIGISGYTTYNLLSISAPEIKGKWAMTEVPGTIREDGTIDNTAPISVMGCILLNACEDKEAAWEFMKWWTSEDIQYGFGQQLEAVLGASARYNTANKEALARMAWTAKDRNSLLAQSAKVDAIEQIPGGYFTERNVNFAKLAVVNDGDNPREALAEYSEAITEEITMKRKEFGLDYYEEQ